MITKFSFKENALENVILKFPDHFVQGASVFIQHYWIQQYSDCGRTLTNL